MTDAGTIILKARRIAGWLKLLIIEHSLPLWSGEGWDQTKGGFVERLDTRAGRTFRPCASAFKRVRKPKSPRLGFHEWTRENPVQADEAREALVRLYRHYLRHPVLGGWYDQFDRDNRSLVDRIPESLFYYILCAVAEAERVLQ